MITPRIEDYLEELFLLESTGRSVTVTDLAERLNITKGTVTATVQKLVDLELLEHERYGTLHLTDAGRLKGMTVFRRHEGFRAFFHEILGLDFEHSSEMACSMEHYIDKVTEERLYAFLECFRKAKAEHQVWVDEIVMAIEKPVLLVPVPLTLCEEGSGGIILRLTAEKNLREKLIKLGFSAGTEIKLLERNEDIFKCKVSHKIIDLPLNEAATIWLQRPSKT